MTILPTPSLLNIYHCILCNLYIFEHVFSQPSNICLEIKFKKFEENKFWVERIIVVATLVGVAI